MKEVLSIQIDGVDAEGKDSPLGMYIGADLLDNYEADLPDAPPGWRPKKISIKWMDWPRG